MAFCESPMNHHSVTIKDIAKLLGISKSTVSRALSEHSDVNLETRNKVLAIAHELQYHPNAIALNLKQQRTQTLGVIVPETENPFFARAVGGIQRIANRVGYNVMVCQSNESYATEKSNLRSLIATHVDGLLISASRETVQTDHFEMILQKNIPVVFFDRICDSLNTSQVVTDNYEVAFEATEYLISQGCTRIATMAGAPHIYTTFNRFRGYRDALIRNQIDLNSDYLLPADLTKDRIGIFTQHLFSLERPPDAIFARNDLMAIEMMYILKKRGLRIPQDVAILGFNNETISQFVEPSLSTIGQPAHDIGAAAAELLLAQIKEPSHRERKLVFSELIVRESTQRKS
jgi:DNA-binding LacI/PurR family transcriptional regulator